MRKREEKRKKQTFSVRLIAGYLILTLISSLGWPTGGATHQPSVQTMEFGELFWV
jgi:hypothetical protein